MKLNNFKKILLFSLLIMQSCIVTHKQRYFVTNSSDSTATDSTTTTAAVSNFSNYKIRSADVLSIKILSIDPVITALFNVEDPTSNNGQTTPGSLYMKGYIVNDSGYVYVPHLGNIHVEGISLAEVQVKVQELVNQNFKNASVIVKFASFKVSVLGEVNHPGYYYFYNEKVSMLEGLAMAGDMTIVGNRKNIRLIREEGGVNKIHHLNINDENVLFSEYFYLMPNDIIYVEPTRTAAAKYNTANLTLIFTAISLTILILNYTNK